MFRRLLELLTDYDANGSFADMAKNINTTDGDGYAWYVRITDLENPKPLSELKYVDESSYEFLKKTELHGGELLMAKRGNIGKVYIFEPRTKYATVAPNMYLLKLNNKVIPHFLYDYFVSEEGNKKLTRLNASSTMGALYKDDVKNIDVIMPSIEEQAMIGNFFQSIDHIITLHQRELDHTKELKKGLLQKMFPKRGETVPEIRFPGFTEPWEQRKLGEFSEMFNGDRGINYPKDSDMVPEGIPFINAGDLQNGQVNLKGCNKISREKFNQLGGAKIQRGDILYCLRGTLGKNAFVDNFDEGTVASSLVDIRPKNIDGTFLFTILNSDIEYRQRTLNDEGAAQPNLSAKNLADFDIPVPSLEEQEEIGAFFATLDNTITLHQRELDHTKELKKGLLQQMFI